MLSIPHLIIIFVVALVVFGPEKLPELARTLGKIMGEFRRATGDLRSTFEDHMRDLEREAERHRIGAPAPSLPSPQGTVPSNPPSALSVETTAASLSAAGQPEQAESQPEPNPETVSDAGKRPA